MIDKLEEEVELVARHVEIFRKVVEDGPIGIVNLSNEMGYPHHKVRYSLRVLEESGFIEPTAQGAVPTEEGHEFIGEFNDRVSAIVERLREVRLGDEQVPKAQ